MYMEYNEMEYGIHNCINITVTAQKMQFSIKDFFSKCDQIRNFWSHLLNKSLMVHFIF